MNKNDLIEYIALALNIDISNKIVYLEINEELNSVKDFNLFRQELKSRVANLNDDFRYLNGFQKFLKFMNEFKIKQLPKRDDEQIEAYCKKLANKCSFEVYNLERQLLKGYTIEMFIENANYTNFGNNGISRFTNKEIGLLESIGGMRYWVYKHSDYSLFLTYSL